MEFRVLIGLLFIYSFLSTDWELILVSLRSKLPFLFQSKKQLKSSAGVSQEEDEAADFTASGSCFEIPSGAALLVWSGLMFELSRPSDSYKRSCLLSAALGGSVSCTAANFHPPPSAVCVSDDSNPSLSKDISSALSTVPECFDSEGGFPLEDELRIEPLSLDGLSMLSDPDMVLPDPSVEDSFRSDRLWMWRAAPFQTTHTHTHTWICSVNLYKSEYACRPPLQGRCAPPSPSHPLRFLNCEGHEQKAQLLISGLVRTICFTPALLRLMHDWAPVSELVLNDAVVCLKSAALSLCTPCGQPLSFKTKK